MRETTRSGGTRARPVRLLVVWSALAGFLAGCRSTTPGTEPGEGALLFRQGATHAGPACDAFTLGVTTMEEVLAAVGRRPESLQRLPSGETLVCWYGWRMRLDSGTYETSGSLDYFLQCRFDVAGLLTWCRQRGFTPFVEGACVCGRVELVE